MMRCQRQDRSSLIHVVNFRKQYISLISLDLIAVITVIRIENYRDRFAKLSSMDFERRTLVQSV